MTMIRALVVDDEPLARSRMQRLLTDHPDVEVVAEAEHGRDAVAAVLQHRPDVVFLDVNMPEMTGTEALEAIQRALPEELWPAAVFTTAYEEHAVKAFELAGTDFLLKPVERDALARALRRVRKVHYAAPPAPTPPAAPAVPTPAPAPAVSSLSEAPVGDSGSAGVGHLAAHRAGKIVRLALAEVACIAVEDTITFAHTPTGKFRLKMTLAEAESRLASPPFVRVSRSAIVQLGWVQDLEPMDSGTYNARLRDPLTLQVTVSRRRARRLRELLGW